MPAFSYTLSPYQQFCSIVTELQLKKKKKLQDAVFEVLREATIKKEDKNQGNQKNSKPLAVQQQQTLTTAQTLSQILTLIWPQQTSELDLDMLQMKVCSDRKFKLTVNNVKVLNSNSRKRGI